MKSSWLVFVAVGLAARDGDALRARGLAATPRSRVISPRGARAILSAPCVGRCSAAALKMDASSSSSPFEFELPMGVARSQARRRWAGWFSRTVRMVTMTLTLLKVMHFSTRSVHASSVPVQDTAQHATRRTGLFAGRARSGAVDPVWRRAGAPASKPGPELASVAAAPRAKPAAAVSDEAGGFRYWLAKAREAAAGVQEELPAGAQDALVLLAATAFILPILANLGLSPILGFLLAGMALGPNGLHLVRDVHTTEVLAELGVVFFLFEMGLELSIERLKALSRDAFGLGSLQFVLTTLALACGCEGVFGLPRAASLVIGGSLALSSSAFVIQLLQERQELGTRYGRASFGILLFQDIAVVPMLVLVPLLGTGGSGAALGTVLLAAALKGFAALALIAGLGPKLLRAAFRKVTASKSQEAFVAITLCTVLSMSTFTKALGLSDTLGAFLAGVLLAESKYRHQVEADIAPFRGILFGLFFITIGYAIDLRLLAANWGILSVLLVAMHAIKAGILLVLCKLGGLSTKASIRTGVLLSQAGEFAFVLFGLAQSHGVIDPKLAKLLLLLAALSMSATPFLADAGANLADRWERRQKRLAPGESSPLEMGAGMDGHGAEGQVLVCGYGSVGRVVCDLLGGMFVPYAACDMDPAVVAAAQEKGLPIYFGDARRPDVLRAFGLLKSATAVVVALDQPSDCLRIVKQLRRDYPELPIFVRATAASKEAMLKAGAQSVVSSDQETALLLGAAVLKTTGKNSEEVVSFIDRMRSGISEITTTEALAMVEVKGEKKDKEEPAAAAVVATVVAIDVDVTPDTDAPGPVGAVA